MLPIRRRPLLPMLLLAVLAGPRAHAQDSTPAEVVKVDKAQGRVTLKHGEIKNLDMPPMTMVFRVANPGMLDGLVPGQRVRITAERINGQFTVTSLDKAP